MITRTQNLLAQLWWSPVRRVFEALARRLTPLDRIVSGPLAGFRFHGGLAHRLGVYELPVQRTLLQHLRAGQIFWDIGGHLGYLSLLAAQRTGAEGRVHTFEPMDENRRHIERAAVDNRLEWIQVHPSAMDERVGEAVLFPGEASTVASLVATDAGDGLGQPVLATTIDTFAAKHRPPHLIKIDVEGAEERVIRGGRELLSSPQAPILLVEVHSVENEEAVIRRLGRADYRWEFLAPAKSRGPVYPRHLLATPPGDGTEGKTS
ncbi:MAG: FkbM family methyltransferase [Acidobacteriota bacterium]